MRLLEHRTANDQLEQTLLSAGSSKMVMMLEAFFCLSHIHILKSGGGGRGGRDTASTQTGQCMWTVEKGRRQCRAARRQRHSSSERLGRGNPLFSAQARARINSEIKALIMHTRVKTCSIIHRAGSTGVRSADLMCLLALITFLGTEL